MCAAARRLPLHLSSLFHSRPQASEARDHFKKAAAMKKAAAAMKKATAEDPADEVNSGEELDEKEAAEEEQIAEAEAVVHRMRMLEAAHPDLSWGDMAVLYRTNAQSRALEEAARLLRKVGNPARRELLVGTLATALGVSEWTQMASARTATSPPPTIPSCASSGSTTAPPSGRATT